MNRTFAALLLALFLSVRLASATDFATEVMEASFKLFHPDSTTVCFLVRQEAPDSGLFVVTAAHAFERTKGETAVLVLRKALPDGSYERKDHTIPIRDKDKPLWTRHEKQDVAVLRLTEPLPVSVAGLPVAALASEAQLRGSGAHVCSPLFLFTYPDRFESNPAGFPVARQGIFASPPTLPMAKYPVFMGDFPAFAGDSGGPVFIDAGGGRPLVVGIVLARHFHDERIKTEYESRTIHHPLGIGSILHAQYVLDTLSAAVKAQAKEGQGTEAASR